MIISLIVLIVVALLCYWVITTFFPEPIRMVALVIVGVIVLFSMLHILGIVGPLSSTNLLN